MLHNKRYFEQTVLIQGLIKLEHVRCDEGDYSNGNDRNDRFHARVNSKILRVLFPLGIISGSFHHFKTMIDMLKVGNFSHKMIGQKPKQRWSRYCYGFLIFSDLGLQPLMLEFDSLISAFLQNTYLFFL